MENNEIEEVVEEQKPKDFTINLEGGGKTSILHIPAKDIHVIGEILNVLLQAKGVNSYITVKDGN